MLTEKPQAKESIGIEELEDGAMLYSEDKVHILNGTSFLVWLYCDGKTTVQQIIDLIKEACPEGAVKQNDIIKTIKKFKTENLVI